MLHFTPPSGWINDPNGLIFYEGEWHLFYQYLPPGAKAKHWGHAVSANLIDWEHLSIALFPDELGEIFSGSCVADPRNTSGFFPNGGGLVAIFTHHVEGQAAPQSQSLAYSSDRGRTWTKFAGNPVLRAAKPDFRDPKVFWHAPTESWVMILAVGDHVEIYRSPDLQAWTLASSYGQGRPGLVWECPDLFPLRDEQGGEVWVLSISFLHHDNFKGKVSTCDLHYVAGDFDGHTFTARTELRRLSQGPDDYASVTFNDAPEGRRILLGWLNHWGYCAHSGQMTLPRELHWRDGVVVQTPALAAGNGSRAEIGESDWAPIEMVTTPWELVLAPGAATCSIEVRKGDVPVFSLRRDAERGVWSLKREAGSFPPAWKTQKENLKSIFTQVHEAPLAPDSREATRVIVDDCSVEVFGDGGRVYFAAQIFPSEGKWEIRNSGYPIPSS